MNKAQFKRRWESNDEGGGICFNDIADCAKAWGVCSVPYVTPMNEVRYAVLKAANVIDAEDYNPVNLGDDE